MELVDYLKLLIPHKDYWKEECDSGLFLVICWESIPTFSPQKLIRLYHHFGAKFEVYTK